MNKKFLLALAAAPVAFLTTACVPMMPGAPTTGPAPAPATVTGTVKSVYDGDTITVNIAGQATKIRLIGIDTPEVANPGWGQALECGGNEARDRLRSIIPNGTQVAVTTVPGRDNMAQDRYLRYVETAAEDVAHTLIAAGLAHADYDGLRKGYQGHPRQDDYRSADAATVNLCEG